MINISLEIFVLFNLRLYLNWHYNYTYVTLITIFVFSVRCYLCYVVPHLCNSCSITFMFHSQPLTSSGSLTLGLGCHPTGYVMPKKTGCLRLKHQIFFFISVPKVHEFEVGLPQYPFYSIYIIIF